MVWIDMKQSDEGCKAAETAVGQGEVDLLSTKHEKVYENWWPGMRRWHLGLICEDSVLQLGQPEILKG